MLAKSSVGFLCRFTFKKANFSSFLRSKYWFVFFYFGALDACSLDPIGQALPVQERMYEPGQLIINRLFGYRGIILNSWKATLFDRNVVNDEQPTAFDPSTTSQGKGRPIYAYTVLADTHDLELCNSSLKSGITFLPDDQVALNTIYIVSGMDYAFHDDIIPYICKEPTPFKNEYFREFMHFDPDRAPHFFPTDNLRRWLQSRWQSLEVKTVHRETTEGLRTTVVPFLMGRQKFRFSEVAFSRYWRYLIRLENLTDEAVQLRERFWKVFSVTGSLESVNGKGVVGVQPLLRPDNPVFQYHSHVQVPVPWAHMWGSFRLDKADGGTVDVKIPPFPLCDKEQWPTEDSKDPLSPPSTPTPPG
uniref:Polymerase delta-interacting protein 2 n=1 Tax=Schistocephalus solidus TaxID=70667 RepID=A0A0X3NLV3_SCHSO